METKNQLSSRTTITASCPKFLKGTVLKHFGGLHPTQHSPPGIKVPDSLQHLSGEVQSLMYNPDPNPNPNLTQQNNFLIHSSLLSP